MSKIALLSATSLVLVAGLSVWIQPATARQVTTADQQRAQQVLQRDGWAGRPAEAATQAEAARDALAASPDAIRRLYASLPASPTLPDVITDAEIRDALQWVNGNPALAQLTVAYMRADPCTNRELADLCAFAGATAVRKARTLAWTRYIPDLPMRLGLLGGGGGPLGSLPLSPPPSKPRRIMLEGAVLDFGSTVENSNARLGELERPPREYPLEIDILPVAVRLGTNQPSIQTRLGESISRGCQRETKAVGGVMHRLRLCSWSVTGPAAFQFLLYDGSITGTTATFLRQSGREGFVPVPAASLAASTGAARSPASATTQAANTSQTSSLVGIPSTSAAPPPAAQATAMLQGVTFSVTMP